MNSMYVIPGIIDGDVVRKQAFERANDKRHPEDTAVHYHRHQEPCNDRCKVYEVGTKEQ